MIKILINGCEKIDNTYTGRRGPVATVNEIVRIALS